MERAVDHTYLYSFTGKTFGRRLSYIQRFQVFQKDISSGSILSPNFGTFTHKGFFSTISNFSTRAGYIIIYHSSSLSNFFHFILFILFLLLPFFVTKVSGSRLIHFAALKQSVLEVYYDRSAERYRLKCNVSLLFTPEIYSAVTNIGTENLCRPVSDPDGRHQFTINSRR